LIDNYSVGADLVSAQSSKNEEKEIKIYDLKANRNPKAIDVEYL